MKAKDLGLFLYPAFTMPTTITKIELQDQLTAELARRLGETEMAVIRQLSRLVEVLPPMTLIELLKEAEQTEKRGGMWTKDGSRRRTKGGTFFALSRQRMTWKQRHYVWPWYTRRGTNDEPARLRGRAGSSTLLGAGTGVIEQHAPMIHAPPSIVNIDSLQSKEERHDPPHREAA